MISEHNVVTIIEDYVFFLPWQRTGHFASKPVKEFPMVVIRLVDDTTQFLVLQ